MRQLRRMQLIAIFVTLILVCKVIDTNEHANKVAVDPSPRLIIINGPVIVVLAQVGGVEVVLRYLNDLTNECSDGNQTCHDVEKLSLVHVLLGQEEAGNHEPDVIGEIPRRLDAKVLLTPWQDVIDHENVEQPIRFAAVTFDELVKARASSTKEHNKLPEEEYHEHVERHQSEVAFEEDADWMSPENTFINLKLFENREAENEASDPEEDVDLEVSPDDPHEFEAVHPLRNNIQVPQWATHGIVVRISKDNNRYADYLHGVQNLQLFIVHIILSIREQLFQIALN